jgi:antitoxin CptB
METRDAKRKRLYMRSIRRGIKEMDLILTAYAGQYLADMTDDELTVYDAFLSEFDHDIYAWVLGTAQAPAQYADIMQQIIQIAHGVAATPNA